MISEQILPFDDLGSSYYSGGSSAFFVPDKTFSKRITSFATCRDVFAGEWDRTTVNGAPRTEISEFIGFATVKFPDSLNFFNSKIEEIEKILKIELPSVIYRTKHANAIIIRLSPFWLQSETTRSLITLLIRMYALYAEPNDTLEETINRYTLARISKKAILWFLAGNTKQNFITMTRRTYGSYYGFVNEFNELNDADIAAKLSKP